MKKIIGIILALAGIASAAFGILSKNSLAIIGGQDGPTAIYVSGNIEEFWAVAGVIIGVILCAIGIIMVIKKK